MRIISKKTLLTFAQKHPDSEGPLLAWHSGAQKASWEKPNDIKGFSASADIINAKRVVFNIKGNHYRLVVDVEYEIGIVFIVRVLTHAEYDKLNIEEIEYEG